MIYQQSGNKAVHQWYTTPDLYIYYI